MEAARGSCSDWARMSAAIKSGLASSSAMIAISDGPAGKSISTRLRTIIFAAVTYWFPGPTIFSTGAMLLVPYAMAAIACAPPVRYISSTPAISQATSVRG
ncbi:MAG: hypothetical protein BWY05_00978 [Euryarchaeota archaeon ADurb.Bin165]|nr:MAG: hypothetical protein BWY05_00978 [Euryarchaeota archaeon ADurb.Bin165]